MRLTALERKRIAEIKDQEAIVDWDPDFKFAHRITFNADQFEAWTNKMLPQAKKLHPIKDQTPDAVTKYGVTMGGDYYLYKFVMPTHVKVTPGFLSYRQEPWIERFGLKLMKAGEYLGEARFDRPVAIPILAEMDHLDRPWMSLTPNEIMTQRSGLRRARGHVLIAGLGLGWFTRMVLARKQVKRVTVVELNSGVIDHLGKPLLHEHGDRLNIVQEDIWKYVEKQKEEYDSYLFDIWKSYMTAGHDRSLQSFKREHPGKVWGWGDLQTYPLGC